MAATLFTFPTTRRSHLTRFHLESLESRTLLAATLFVTAPGIPSDPTHFQTLQAALNVALDGDTIVLQQGFSAGNFGQTSLSMASAVGATSIRTLAAVDVGTVITIGNGGSDLRERALVTAVSATGTGDYLLTLAGALTVAHNGSAVDALNGALGGMIGINKAITLTADSGVILPFHLQLWQGSSNVTLQNLNLGDRFLFVSGTNNTVTTSTLSLVMLTRGVAGNTFSQNTFNVASGDGLSLDHNDNTTISGNTFNVASNFAFGIFVRNSDDVFILNNAITTGHNGTGIYVSAETSTGAASADLRNNIIHTTDGYGIFLNKSHLFATLEARVQGNNVSDNARGIHIRGDGATAGLIDLGGGLTGFGTSSGGNDFSAVTSSDNLHYAIGIFGTAVDYTVQAQSNLWGVATPLSVVADAAHTLAAAGTGHVNVAAQTVEVLNGNASNLAAVETGTTSGIVATFSSNMQHAAGDFFAIIDWGDGDTSDAMVVADGKGGFAVMASHTWDQPGSFTFTVFISTGVGGGTGASIQVQGTVAVDQRAITLEASDITVDKKKGFNGAVATFSDNLQGTTANSYVASVAWSDGKITTATVKKNADGTFSISTNRTFTIAGVIVASVSLSTLDGIFSATDSFTAQITDKTIKNTCKGHIKHTLKFIRKVIAKHNAHHQHNHHHFNLCRR